MKSDASPEEIKFDSPIITVITVTYNLLQAERKDFFKKCVQSVAEQTYPNIEHLIIDGASNDGTVELIEECKHQKMKVISQADNGLWEAMNTGAKMATGKYLCYLNSDDYYLTDDIIAECVEQLESSGANASIANAIYLNHDGSLSLKYDYYSPIAKELFYTNMTYMHETFICKKSIYEELGFHELKYKTGIDYHFNIKMILADKFNCIHIDKPMLARRLGGTTHNKDGSAVASTINAAKAIRDDISDSCNSIHENFFQRLKDSLIELKLQNFNYEIFLNDINKRYPITKYALSIQTPPLLTVITVTYNLIQAGRKDFFKKCVQSIVEQNYPNIEHLIIDGASSDGTLELIEKCKHEKMKVISQADSGLWEAMNTGAQMANGKYLCYLNSDDYYLTNNILALCIEQLEVTQSDYSTANAHPITYEGTLVNPSSLNTVKKPTANEICYRSMTYQHETLVCKKAIYQELGFHNLKYKSAIDYQFNIALVLAGKKRTHVDMPMLAVRPGGATVDLDGKASQATITNMTLLWKDLYPFCPITEEIISRYYSYKILPQSMLEMIKEHYVKLNISNFDYKILFDDIETMKEKKIPIKHIDPKEVAVAKFQKYSFKHIRYYLLRYVTIGKTRKKYKKKLSLIAR